MRAARVVRADRGEPGGLVGRPVQPGFLSAAFSIAEAGTAKSVCATPPPAGTETDLGDVCETERQPIYVACTRARDRLPISGVRPGSELIQDTYDRTKEVAFPDAVTTR